MNAIYLDNAATTAPDMEIFSEASEFCRRNFYNPSALYRGGLEVRQRLNEARAEIASHFFGKKVYFTSCGTEADNTAVFGYLRRGGGITTLGEHAAVASPFAALKERGLKVVFAPLTPFGGVDEEKLLSLVDETTSLVSVIHVNNETGEINDIEKLAKKVKEINPKTIFHSDGVQGYGKIRASIPDVDLYSVSAHKIGGLKGVGALIVRENLRVPPFIFGGGQENNVRSGTENVLGILDFAAATKKAYDKIDEHYSNAAECKKAFLQNIDNAKIKVISSENASPYIISVSCVGLKGEVVQHLMEDEGVIVGTGSACSAKKPFSAVLKACGHSSEVLGGALRISFGFGTSPSDAAFAARTMNAAVEKLSKVIK